MSRVSDNSIQKNSNYQAEINDDRTPLHQVESMSGFEERKKSKDPYDIFPYFVKSNKILPPMLPIARKNIKISGKLGQVKVDSLDRLKNVSLKPVQIKSTRVVLMPFL